MNTLNLDIETYSSVDLAKAGVYKYAASPDFEILLMAYSYNGTSIITLDFTTGNVDTTALKAMLTDPAILKTAFNAAFERTCLAAYFGEPMPPEQWSCTMAESAQAGLPLSLDAVSKVLALDEQKDAAGKALIRYFCGPCKPTKANGERTRNLPHHAPDKWQAFKDYCAQDVRTEMAIRNKIRFFKVPAEEVAVWNLDQKINDTGVGVDNRLVRNAIRLDKEFKTKLTDEATALTGLLNPNSASQLKKWLEAETDEAIESLNKKALPAIADASDSDVVKRVVRLRQEMAKTSVKKYTAMHTAVGSDGRVRGLLQYYGANRTGRWAGRLVQVQNLPKNHLPDLDTARDAVKLGDLDTLETLFDNVPDTLSQLIRTAFVAAPGSRFLVADFSAIEARVLAWLAGEKWRLDVFDTHGKIYEASAAQMFKVPITAVTKGSTFRQKGKVAELALGYQGGPGALIAMGALDMGLSEDDLPMLVRAWRNANTKIVKYWYDINSAATIAVRDNQPTTVRNVKFQKKGNALFVELPSGRSLVYLRPKIAAGKFGEVIKYEGMDQTTKKWGVQETYGGKLVENITQAIARDCLSHAMLELDKAGYRIVMHVHDEVVCEMPNGEGSLLELNSIMSRGAGWAKGLPLKADSYETNYYKKDD